MARGQEETSTNQVGRRRASPWESSIVSSLVVAMSVEELRSVKPEKNSIFLKKGKTVIRLKTGNSLDLG